MKTFHWDAENVRQFIAAPPRPETTDYKRRRFEAAEKRRAARIAAEQFKPVRPPLAGH
jgi:hypothetical protein